MSEDRKSRLPEKLCQFTGKSVPVDRKKKIFCAWWEASAKLGGWFYTRIPTILEGKRHDAQLERLLGTQVCWA